MFPETDGISSIISDTIRVVFERRLVDRVLRLWTEKARDRRFRASTKSILVCSEWIGRIAS